MKLNNKFLATLFHACNIHFFMFSLIVGGLAKTMSFNKSQKKLSGDQRNTMTMLQIHHIRLWGNPSCKKQSSMIMRWCTIMEPSIQSCVEIDILNKSWSLRKNS